MNQRLTQEQLNQIIAEVQGLQLRQEAELDQQQDRITLESNNENLKNISRSANSELFYRVTLKDAPIGKKLNLSCNWIDPSGQIVKQNNYQTREVKTSIWDTFCRYSINSTAPVGNWKVEMFLEGRKISEEPFVVQ